MGCYKWRGGGGGGGLTSEVDTYGSLGIEIVCDVATHGQLAGHRVLVREEDVPPPAEGRSFY